MSFRFLLSFLIIFKLSTLLAQSQQELIIEPILESIAENAADDFDYSEISIRLNHVLKHPININTGTREQFNDLLFLSPLMVQNLLDYRQTSGGFINLLELQSIDGFHEDDIKSLIPFVTLTPINGLKNASISKFVNSGRNEVILTSGRIIQKQKGYRDPENTSQAYYTGSSNRFLARYKYVFGSTLSAALIMEKDAGEQFFSGNKNKGFDFYSGNIAYQSEGKLKKFIVGDYSLQFGQGLGMWTGLSFGKGAAVATITKNNIGLKPYSSTNELLYLRGLSASIQLKKWIITPFASYRNLDAGIENSNSSLEISSLSQTGLHRTNSEIENKGSLKQSVFGTNVQYSVQGLRIGSTAYQTNLSAPIAQSKQPENKFDFVGKNLTNVSVYYNYNWRNVYFFGETATSLKSGWATINGAMASLSPQVSLIMFHRNYQKNYHSFFNQSISESSTAVNERGFYTGIVIAPNRKTELTLYADVFRFPWLKFRVNAPSSGYEILSQLSYSPSKRIKAAVRYKSEMKQENETNTNNISYLENVSKKNLRLELSYKLSENFQIRNRVEVVEYKKGLDHETGTLIFQDILYNPMRSRFSGNFRFALFDTPGFNSRLYAYENDVLYSYSVPAYQNKGKRFYINGRYRINRFTDFWFRYAISSYTDLTSIGSGLDQIDGPKKSDIKLQLKFQF